MEFLDLSLAISPTVPQLQLNVDEAQPPLIRHEVDRDHWTYRKALNKLATINNPNIIGKIALKVPGKSSEQVQNIFAPSYERQGNEDMHVLVKNDRFLPSTVPKSFTTRGKAPYWTEREHERFLLGINKHGRGMWKQIAENYVKSDRDWGRGATKFLKITDGSTSSTTAATRDLKHSMAFSSSSKRKVLDDSDDDDVIMLESRPRELILAPRRRIIPRTLNLFPEVSDLASSCQHDHEEEDTTLPLFPKYPMNTCI